tara:strand:+ start:12316 stop:12999 length:684 start_codon:yes stop_codon:yes gene_type:complete
MFGIGLALPAVTSGFSFGSFGTFFAIASGLQTILGTYSSIRNSQIQSKNLRTAAMYERQRAELQAKQQQIKINKQEKILLSEKRAAFTASGVQFTGSPLLVMQNTIEEADDARFWAEKELEQSLLETDMELAGALAAESFNRRTSLLEGVAQLGLTAYFAKDYFGSSSSVPSSQFNQPSTTFTSSQVRSSINTAGNIKLNRAVNPMFVGQTSPISGGVYNTAGGGMR